MSERIFRDRQKGHRITQREWNQRGREMNRLRTIQGIEHSGTIINSSPAGVFAQSAGSSGISMTLCRCTVADYPSDGLHTFAEIDLDGLLIDGGKEFTNCRLLGDWTQGTWLPATDEAPYYDGTEAMVFSYNGTNVAWVIGSFYME